MYVLRKCDNLWIWRTKYRDYKPERILEAIEIILLAGNCGTHLFVVIQLVRGKAELHVALYSLTAPYPTPSGVRNT